MRSVTSRYYDGSKTTTRHINQLLPRIFEEITKVYHDRPDLILAAWPEIVGAKLAPMAQAVFFRDGVLTVKVKNSTLYSLLNQNDKPRLIKNLRDKFPKTIIKTIHFRLG